ncbi:hypothetical protein [Neobacillus terrae]|uniref:hypothetical protein n=1 Tax=Neobacillus terrae TaxID=3034837 RepID=UPI00140A327E|nr:hypothetical protein [Neobacillus terrae]NHM33615.1 hypothetical protein [Neobacillus terrae]
MGNVIKKTTSILLSVVLVISLAPFQINATTVSADHLPSQFQSPPSGSKNIVGEDLSKREENIKHFLLKDHTYEADVYPFPVHYKTDGQWKDIDNSLSEKTDSETNDKVLENKENMFKVHFAEKTNKKELVKMKSGNYTLGWNLDDTQDSEAMKDRVSIPGYDSLTDNEKREPYKS